MNIFTFGHRREVSRGLFTLVFAIAAVCALLLSVVACSSSESTNTTPSSQATANESNSPRVVALDWRYEEMLVALGITPVGTVEIGKSTEPPTLKGKLEGATSVGQAKQPNLEVIQSLKPDLILASPTRQAAIMDQLKQIAPTEAYSDTSYSDVLDSLEAVGEKVGRKDKAVEVRQRIEKKIGEAKSHVKPGTRTVLVGWTKNTLYTWVKNSFIGSLLEAVGYDYAYDGEKSAIESKTNVAKLTGDKLPGMKVDVLYLYNDTTAFHNSPYGNVVANVVDVDQDVWSRTRGPLAAEEILDQIISHNS